MSSTSLKRLGIGILIVPVGFLSLFLFGEVLSGDMSGLGHLFQILPLILILGLAYKKPFAGGLLLLFSGLVLGILYMLRAPFEPMTILLVEVSLFVPPFLSGLLLIYSSKKT